MRERYPKGAKAVKLEDCSVEDVLAELRHRECETIGGAKGREERMLGGFESPDLMAHLKTMQKVIYEMDDRTDLFEVSDSAIQRLSNGVAGLVDITRVRDNGDGTSTILTVRFANSHNLCSREKFRDQPTAPHCTGFLVAPDILATAGHCVNTSNLPRTRFIFGYRMINATEARTIVSNTDIFSGAGIIARREIGDGADFALVRLDRPAVGHPVLSLRRDGKIADDAQVFVIGHPAGLPLKYAPNAVVRDNGKRDFFAANLDTYGGNSGSPVFNQSNGVVEGILVRGETDFVRVGNCFESTVCPTTGCRGEDVTRASVFASLVPDTPGDKSIDVQLRLSNLEQQVTSMAETIKQIRDRLL